MRWPDGRSGRTDPDDRPAPRCGNGRWHRAPCDAAMQDATSAVPKSCCPLRGRCRPPRGWAGSSPTLPPGTLHLVRARYFDRFEWAGHRLQMAPGEVQVDGGVGELGMAKQNLDGAQVGAGFQHMSCETMPQAVRRYVLGDAGTLGGLVYRLPDDLFRNRDIGPPSLHRTWEQIGLGLHPAPILAQSLQQLGGQQDIAVAGSLALANVNDHALAVDVGDLEMAHLGSAQARCIQHHHHGAMHKVAGRIDQARYLLLVKYGRQSQRPLRKWNVIGKVGPPESLDVEKAQSAGAKPNSPRRQLTIAK